MFRDRVDAGRRLAALLGEHEGRDDVVVLGIPRGGVVVAHEVAKALGLSLDVVVTSKIGAPGNPEYAIGAVDPDGRVTAGAVGGHRSSEVELLARDAQKKVARRIDLYCRGQAPSNLAGVTVIVVDDGIATGLTAIAAVQYVRSCGAARVILAAPVISARAIGALERFTEEVVAVVRPETFSAVSEFYRSFGQVGDDEVIAALASAGRSAEA